MIKKTLLILFIMLTVPVFAQSTNVQETLNQIKETYNWLRTTAYDPDDVFQVDERLQKAENSYTMLKDLFKKDREEHMFSSDFREELETVNIFLSRQISTLQFYKDTLYKSTEKPDQYHF